MLEAHLTFNLNTTRARFLSVASSSAVALQSRPQGPTWQEGQGVPSPPRGPAEPDTEPPTEPAVPLSTAPHDSSFLRVHFHLPPALRTSLVHTTAGTGRGRPGPGQRRHTALRAAQTATLVSSQETPLLPALCPCPPHGPPPRPSMVSDLSAKIQVLVRSVGALRVTPEAQPFCWSEHRGGHRRQAWGVEPGESRLTALALPLTASVFPSPVSGPAFSGSISGLLKGPTVSHSAVPALEWSV